jgi:hypothetical protein
VNETIPRIEKLKITPMKRILCSLLFTCFIASVISLRASEKTEEAILISTSKYFKAVCVYTIDSVYGPNFVGVANMYNNGSTMSLETKIAPGYHVLELGVLDNKLYTLEFTFEAGKTYYLNQVDGEIELYIDKIKDGNKVNAVIKPVPEYQEPSGPVSVLQYKSGLVASAIKEKQFLIAVMKIDGTYRMSKSSFGFDPRCHVFNTKDYSVDVKLPAGKHEVVLTAQGRNNGELVYTRRPLKVNFTAEENKTYTFKFSFLDMKDENGDLVKVEIVEKD